jgi:hypothetical protein
MSGKWVREHSLLAITAGFVVLVIVPLYVVTAAVVVRSNVLAFNGPAFNDEQYKALWAFLGVGFATAATVLGALLTKSYNDRTLTQQDESARRKEILDAETNTRLALDTAVGALELIKKDEQYAGKAVTAGALGTLVHVGHPIIALRVVQAALREDAVDIQTASWLVDQVLSDATTCTEAARAEAVNLLDVNLNRLTSDQPRGSFEWPDCVIAKWPPGLGLNTTRNLVNCLVKLLLSRDYEWWNSEGNTHTWIIFTLDEAHRATPDDFGTTGFATLLLQTVAADEPIVGTLDSRSRADVAERLWIDISGWIPANPDLWDRALAWVEDANTYRAAREKGASESEPRAEQLTADGDGMVTGLPGH